MFIVTHLFSEPTLSSGDVNQYSGHQSIERVILSMVKGERLRPYFTDTLPDSGRDSNMGHSGVMP